MSSLARTSLGLRVALRGDLRVYLTDRLAAPARGAMAAARRAEGLLKSRLRQDVIAGGLGERTANTWRGAVYPRRGESLTPAVLVYSRAAHIARAFEAGVTIRSADGFWLAIPTENVPEWMRRGARNRPRITPGQLERRLGIRLRLVVPPKSGAHGRFGLLVADRIRRKTGKRGGWAKASERALKRGDVESDIVMFVLVRQATLKKRLHVATIEAAMQREWPSILQDEIDRAIVETDREHGA